MLARGLVLAGLLLGTLAAPALAADSTLTLSSGVTSGVTVQGPGDSSAVSATVCSPVASGWAGAISGTQWIGRQADCTQSVSTGTFTYTTTFSVPSGATGQQLSGSLLADDTVTVQLNGHQIFSGGNPSTISTFSTTDTSLFNSGTNTLTFAVNNAGGPSGLDFQVTVSANSVNLTSSNPNVNSNSEGEGAHGACVSAVAHSATHGRGHGQAVSAAAHSCGHGVAGPSHADNDGG